GTCPWYGWPPTPLAPTPLVNAYSLFWLSHFCVFRLTDDCPGTSPPSSINVCLRESAPFRLRFPKRWFVPRTHRRPGSFAVIQSLSPTKGLHRLSPPARSAGQLAPVPHLTLQPAPPVPPAQSAARPLSDPLKPVPIQLLSL